MSQKAKTDAKKLKNSAKKALKKKKIENYPLERIQPSSCQSR
jgi:hypothetical protein